MCTSHSVCLVLYCWFGSTNKGYSSTTKPKRRQQQQQKCCMYIKHIYYINVNPLVCSSVRCQPATTTPPLRPACSKHQTFSNANIYPCTWCVSNRYRFPTKPSHHYDTKLINHSPECATSSDKPIRFDPIPMSFSTLAKREGFGHAVNLVGIPYPVYLIL